MIFGQEEKTHKIKIYDLGIYQGMNSNGNSKVELTEFQKLAPSSVMLQQDFTGFSKSSLYMGPSTAESIFNVNLGFLFYNNKKQTYNANPKLNLGVYFMGSTGLNAYYSKSETIRFDTLSSTNSSSLVYLDSVKSQSYQMNYLYQQIGINANLVFRTHPEARWSLYGGVGISAVVSLMAETNISHNWSEMLRYSTINNSYIVDEYNTDVNSELHPNKTNVSVFAYIPLGLDFRIAKKSEFWNKMHLVMEMQPGIAIDNIPELGTRTYGAMRGNFGVRIEI